MEAKVAEEKKETKKKKTANHYIEAAGRRKTSIARILLMDRKGNIVVNDMPALEYFKAAGMSAKYILDRPFASVGRRNKFDVLIKVEGGGIKSQLGAIVHGIARALDKYDRETFHRVLKKHGLLTRDSRMKERRKYGLMGARKKKASPKR